MVEIKAKLKTRGAAYGLKVHGKLVLTSAQRSKPGAHARTESGEELLLNFPASEALRHGDHVTTSDGRVLEIAAASEKVLQVEAPPTALARLAYRLGNDHVPMEAGDAWVRVAVAADVSKTLKELGLSGREVEAAFNPDFPSTHAHEHHGHEHHGHDHDHGHDHHHGHGHHHHK